MNQNIPTHLKDFHNAIMQISNNGYYVDVSQAFQDVIEYGIQGYSIKTQDGVLQRISDKYNGLNNVHKAFAQLPLTMQKTLPNDNSWGWSDLLGTYYESVASMSKKGMMGQFFTPEHICDMTAKMILTKSDKIQRINDPTCGSGRMLLAGYVVQEGRAELYGEDLDPLCAKMTALNMLLHGATGEVICHNSLMPDDFNFGYKLVRYGKMTAVQHIEKEESRILGIWRNKIKEKEIKEPVNEEIQSGVQLTLF